jgi:hypothetical protein
MEIHFFFIYIGTCEMDVVLNHPNNIAYDAKTCEVESMEERPISGKCVINSNAITSAVNTSDIDSMEDKPSSPTEDVLNS